MNDKIADKSETAFGQFELEEPKFSGMTTLSTYVTMRDGVDIAVDVFLPKGLTENEKIPALLNQTRYWRVTELRKPF